MEQQIELKDYSRAKYIWLFSTYFLTIGMIAIGGLTRLTDSGLSMVEWKIILGSLPPLGESGWYEAFELYKKYPEFKYINTNMTLNEFKFIYLMEYSHRMMGRLLGLMIFVPTLFFWRKKSLSPKELGRCLILLLLVTTQGLAGWYMVKSGLVNVPSVSQYRLVLHLFLALTFLNFILWYAMDTYIHSLDKVRQGLDETVPAEKKDSDLSLWLLVVLLGVQIILGGFVAGMDAGHISHTFPKMLGHWIPPNLFDLTPWVINFFENGITVHFFHRVLAMVSGSYALVFCVLLIAKDKGFFLSKWAVGFSLLIVIQMSLGVLTVVLKVPVWTASLHQIVGVFIWSMMIVLIYYKKNHHRI